PVFLVVSWAYLCLFLTTSASSTPGKYAPVSRIYWDSLFAESSVLLLRFRVGQEAPGNSEYKPHELRSYSRH
ncbi:Hypothetical predicted protein, partial [Pelobates cultripes]